MTWAAAQVVASGADATQDKANLPLISKRVEKAFKAPCKEPNDLAFVAEGLWIFDQVDPNSAFLVRSEDGSVIREIQTESIHGRGIALYNGALWIASTKTSDGTPAKTMKVDPKTGKTLKQWVTPESGIWTKGPNATHSGAHGIKFVNNQYWMAVPASGKLYLMEAESDEIVRTIPRSPWKPTVLYWFLTQCRCPGATGGAGFCDPLCRVSWRRVGIAPPSLRRSRVGPLWERKYDGVGGTEVEILGVGHLPVRRREGIDQPQVLQVESHDVRSWCLINLSETVSHQQWRDEADTATQSCRHATNPHVAQHTPHRQF